MRALTCPTAKLGAAVTVMFACYGAAATVQAQAPAASSASPAALVAEVRKSFTVNGKPIPPEIFRDFGDGDLADSNNSIWITVDVLAATGSNRYYDDIKADHGSYSQKAAACPQPPCEETGYLYIGSTDNGLLVVVASYSGGGSGDFETLHILDRAAARGFDDDGKPYARIDLTDIRNVALGDRWSGQVSIAKNTIHIATERNGPGARTDGPPATIEATRP
jgi:hypothetical protein